MPEQLELFKYEGTLDFRLMWQLKKKGIEDAVIDLLELIRETQTDPPLRQLPIMFFDIAKQRMQIDMSADIPVGKNDVFSQICRQLHDEREHIRNKAEAESGLLLIPVNELGENVLNGGLPTAGFDLRESPAGTAFTRHRAKMSIGQIQKSVRVNPSMYRNPERATLMLQELSTELVHDDDQTDNGSNGDLSL